MPFKIIKINNLYYVTNTKTNRKYNKIGYTNKTLANKLLKAITYNYYVKK